MTTEILTPKVLILKFPDRSEVVSTFGFFIFIFFLYPDNIHFKILIIPTASLHRLKRLKMTETILVSKTNSFFVVSTSTSYFIGAVIALLIMGYLFYSLVKPEKF